MDASSVCGSWTSNRSRTTTIGTGTLAEGNDSLVVVEFCEFDVSSAGYSGRSNRLANAIVVRVTEFGEFGDISLILIDSEFPHPIGNFAFVQLCSG